MRKVVTFILLRPDNRILMQLRDDNPRWFPNHWAFPGANCEKNEEPLDTVIREIPEEYGIRVSKTGCQFLFDYDVAYDPAAHDYVFLCRVDFEQKPTLNEGADLAWLTLEEIKARELGFDSKPIIERLEALLTQNPA